MNPAPIARLLSAWLAFFACACTNTSSSSSAGSGAGSGDDGGASSSAPLACAYVATLVTSCNGDFNTSSSDECVDQPCDQLSLDPNPISAGTDCSSHTDYTGLTELHETCDQWRSGGSGASSDGDGGTCASLQALGTTPCDVCVTNFCGSAWCGCTDDTSLDDAGVPRCVDYLGCLSGCIGDAGAASVPGCESRCASGYGAAERAPADALMQCYYAHCHTSDTCG